jgi:DNA invertase Pin-like site-specific DNA recombinase
VKAAIYSRISKDATGHAAGVKRQEGDCRQLAEDKGWEVVQVYRDNDISATSGRRRPGYEGMLGAIQDGQVQAVVAWHPDRLYRRMSDLESLIDLVDSHKTKIATVMAGEVDLSTASGRGTARILGSVARMEVERSSERITAAFRAKASKGKPHRGGVRPFGYMWDGTRFVPVPDEAKLIREGAKRILAGESRRRITQDWHARGVRTQQGKPWSVTRLADVMRSPMIAGLRTYQGEVVSDGDWKPILDRKTWERVGRTLKRAGKLQSGRQRHVLSGLVVCGNCGSKMFAKYRSERGTRTYACLSDKATACGRMRVLANPVERLVLAPEIVHYAFPRILHLTAGDEDGQRIQDRLDELSEYESEVAENRRKGLISAVVFTQQLEAIRQERDDLSSRLSDGQPKWVKTWAGEILEGGVPSEFIDPDVIAFYHEVAQQVYEKIEILAAVKGRNKFDPHRVVLHFQKDYPLPRGGSRRVPLC